MNNTKSNSISNLLFIVDRIQNQQMSSGEMFEHWPNAHVVDAVGDNTEIPKTRKEEKRNSIFMFSN